MKTKFFFYIFLIIMFTPLDAKIIGELPTILKPDRITIDGNDLLVTEGSTVSIYSLEPLKFVRKFGGKGEGPGEFLMIPYGGIGFNVYPDFIFVHNRFKIFYFTRDGHLKDERRVPHTLYKITPLKNNFVAYERVFKGAQIFLTISLYNSQLQKIREFHKEEDHYHKQGKINILPDYSRFYVYKNQLFLFKVKTPFTIEVLDSNGNYLYKADLNLERHKLTKKFKDRIINWLKDNIRPKFLWNHFKSSIFFPELLPSIRDIKIIDEKIYLQTFNPGKDKVEFILMDLKGQPLNKILLDILEPDLVKTIPFAIKDEKLYYLIENEEYEEWELHSQPIYKKDGGKGYRQKSPKEYSHHGKK